MFAQNENFGKSNIQVTILLNLPNPSDISPLKFFIFRTSGQSAVVLEYMSEISKLGDFEGWGHSVCNNCVCPFLCNCSLLIGILSLVNNILKPT